jgi:hypothetical protein
MRTVQIFSFLVMLSLASHIVSAVQPSDELIKALIHVESKGNDNAVGDTNLRNQAYGCLQIRQPACDDVNRVYGTNYQAKMCLGDRDLSIKICKLYMDIYATEKRLGEVTNEKMARIWNGGPNGYKNKRTEPYWEKVRVALGEK